MSRKLQIGRHIIAVTNEEKILFPDDGITKFDLIEYYRKMAPFLVRLIKNRPISIQRFPDGIGHEGFYQKDKPDYFPLWLRAVSIKKKDNTYLAYMLCNHEATPVYLANQGCIAIHAWLCKIDQINYPDRMIFDLDPSGSAQFVDIKWVARMLRKELELYNLVSFVMTTGSRGVHVVVPLKRQYTFDQVRLCAQFVGQKLVDAYPSKCTMEMHIAKRGDKIFIDTLRNAFGQTGVAPYSVRPRPGAPVAMPVAWDEFFVRVKCADQFTIKNIFHARSHMSDPWFSIHVYARSLSKLMEAAHQNS